MRTTVSVAWPPFSLTAYEGAPMRISVSTICSVAAMVEPSVGERPMNPVGSGVSRVRLTVFVPPTTPSLWSGTVTLFVVSPAPNSTWMSVAV